MDKGLIHIYCGDGKGKTTASLGLALRCAGRGFKVLIIQFLKSQDTGELHALAEIPNISIIRGKDGAHFSFAMTDEEKKHCLAVHNANLLQGIEMSRREGIDLLILDEVIGAYNKDLIDHKLLVGFLENKPEGIEVVMTGRDPQAPLTNLADYISEIIMKKHPISQGVSARLGIER